MNIAVIISLIPEAEAKLNITNDNKRIEASNKKFIINPLDEFALEEAIRTKEKFGGEVKIIAYSVIDDIANAEVLLRSALAVGADNAIFIENTENFSQALIAKNICHYLSDFKPDIIFTGNKNIFYNSTELPVIVSTLFELNCLTEVIKLDFRQENENHIITICEREIEIGKEKVEIKLPCVLAVNKGINEPRYPKLVDIMRAKSKPFIMKKAEIVDDISDVEKIDIVINNRENHVINDTDEEIKKLAEILKTKL